MNLDSLLYNFCIALSPKAFHNVRHLGGEYAKTPPDDLKKFFYLNFGINFLFTGWAIEQTWRLGKINEQDKLQYERAIYIQMEFIHAHEFSHIILGHLSESNTVSLFSPLLKDTVVVYNPSQQMEYEADKYAMKMILEGNVKKDLFLHQAPKIERMRAVDALFSFFAFFEGIQDFIKKVNGEKKKFSTHPRALSRSENLRDEFKLINNEMDQTRQYMLAATEVFKISWKEIREEVQTKLKQSYGIRNINLINFFKKSRAN